MLAANYGFAFLLIRLSNHSKSKKSIYKSN